MQIELSEILTCPDCRSPQGLIVMVEELDDGGRVREGELGCSRCQRRYPVRGGVADLTAGGAGPGEAGPGGGAPGGDARGDADRRPPSGELAAAVGGLLDVTGVRGDVVLGHGLAPAAGRLAEIAGEARIAALVGAADGTSESGGEERPGASFTVLRAPAGRLPLLPGKVHGVALWRGRPESVEDARRSLRPGGRLAALRPGAEVRADVESSDLEVLASEERAVVARRRE